MVIVSVKRSQQLSYLFASRANHTDHSDNYWSVLFLANVRSSSETKLDVLSSEIISHYSHSFANALIECSIRIIKKILNQFNSILKKTKPNLNTMQFKLFLVLAVVVVSVLTSFVEAEEILNDEVCKIHKYSLACGSCCTGNGFNTWEFKPSGGPRCVCKLHYVQLPSAKKSLFSLFSHKAE